MPAYKRKNWGGVFLDRTVSVVKK